MVFKERGLIKTYPEKPLSFPPSLAIVTANKTSIIIDLGNLCVVNLKMTELHNPQPCNMTLHPAASSLFLMSVSLSRGILTEMVSADSTRDITSGGNVHFVPFQLCRLFCVI